MAALARYTGDFALAQDVAQEAVAEALVTWSRHGPPANPVGWLLTTARRRAIDSFRPRSALDARYAELDDGPGAAHHGDHHHRSQGRRDGRSRRAARSRPMDSLVLGHEQRVQALQTQVDTGSAEARHFERELEAERRHTLRLQAALVERDERITTLTENLADRDRRLTLIDSVSAASHSQWFTPGGAAGPPQPPSASTW